jgi:hypothetical protein
MNLLAHFLETTLQLPNLGQFDLTQVAVRLIALLPLVGGYLLAREGRGNLLFEVFAVLLLVLATVVPFQSVGTATVTSVATDFLNRWPVMVFLLGMAFVRDGGGKMVFGIILMAVSGLILLPRP